VDFIYLYIVVDFKPASLSIRSWSTLGLIYKIQLFAISQTQSRFGDRAFTVAELLLQNIVSTVLQRSDVGFPFGTMYHQSCIDYTGTFLATLTFKPLSSDEPAYLRSLLITHQPACNLQSSTLNLLTVTSPRINLSSRAFRHSATAIWNNLPADICNANSLHDFKRRLKTHFLRLTLVIVTHMALFYIVLCCIYRME